MRILSVLVCLALCLGALWAGFYSLHLIHAADYAESGGGYAWHWADVPVLITTIAAIIFFGLIASVFGEDL